nr:survival motor neuron protein-like isoform X3 [Chelonoidis abingdonii]
MAECAGEIVYQKEGQQETLGAGDKDQASKTSESSASSGAESEGDVEEEEEEKKEEEGSQWKVGDACCAVWSRDRLLYPARIVSLSKEGDTCVVEYEHYGNREEQRLRDLFPPDRSPDDLLEPQRMWKAGDACSAIWSEDGLLYPAIVRLVDAVAGTCLVEFVGYGNKEQQALEELLPPCGAVDGDLRSWRAEVDAPGVPRGRSPSFPQEPPRSWRRQNTKGEWTHYFPPPPKSGSWWPGPLLPFGPPPRRSGCPPVSVPAPPRAPISMANRATANPALRERALAVDLPGWGRGQTSAEPKAWRLLKGSTGSPLPSLVVHALGRLPGPAAILQHRTPGWPPL